MRLTERTDHALRVLMYLAASRRRHTVVELASNFEVSAHHLTKTVQHLQRLGWVSTTPGRGGGVELAIEAGALRAGDVVRAFEPDLDLVECFRAGGECTLRGPCRLAGVLDDARRAFLTTLDDVTIHDLVVRRESRLLRVASVAAGSERTRR